MVMLVFVRSAAIAITAIVARRKGEEDYETMNSVLKQGVLLTVLFYVPLLCICFYLLNPILTFAGAQASYIDEAVAYGQFIIIGLFFSALGVMLGAALIGVGNTKAIFKANAIGNVLNVVMSFTLIYGLGPIPALGIKGAGIATMTSYTLIFFLLLYAIHAKDSHLSWHRGSWKFNREILQGIYYIGGSSLGEQAFERWYVCVYQNGGVIRCSGVGNTSYLYEFD